MSAFLHSEVSIRFMYLRDAKKIYTTSGIAYETPASVGLDLRACIEETSLTILPGERETIPCGIAIEPLEKNLAGFVYSRSGLGAIHGLTVAQGVGVIDPDYRGEIIVVLLNKVLTSSLCCFSWLSSSCLFLFFLIFRISSFIGFFF